MEVVGGGAARSDGGSPRPYPTCAGGVGRAGRQPMVAGGSVTVEKKREASLWRRKGRKR
jgi:hypothetical protein